MIEMVLFFALKYGNCTELVQDYPHGVAQSVAAANKVVAKGYGMPEVNKKLYVANKGKDRNKDGVACER